MVFSMHPHAIADNGRDCLYMQDTWLVHRGRRRAARGLPMKISRSTRAERSQCTDRCLAESDRSSLSPHLPQSAGAIRARTSSARIRVGPETVYGTRSWPLNAYGYRRVARPGLAHDDHLGHQSRRSEQRAIRPGRVNRKEKLPLLILRDANPTGPARER